MTSGVNVEYVPVAVNPITCTESGTGWICDFTLEIEKRIPEWDEKDGRWIGFLNSEVVTLEYTDVTVIKSEDKLQVRVLNEQIQPKLLSPSDPVRKPRKVDPGPKPSADELGGLYLAFGGETMVAPGTPVWDASHNQNTKFKAEVEKVSKIDCKVIDGVWQCGFTVSAIYNSTVSGKIGQLPAKWATGDKQGAVISSKAIAPGRVMVTTRRVEQVS